MNKKHEIFFGQGEKGNDSIDSDENIFWLVCAGCLKDVFLPKPEMKKTWKCPLCGIKNVEIER